MAKYKEQTVQVTTWQRVGEFRIIVPVDGVPRFECTEERVVETGGGTRFRMPVGKVAKDITTPAEVFNLVDPATGNPLGTQMSYQDLHAALLSAYRSIAEARDVPPAP